MAVSFRLPDLGEGITEAEIIEWLVAEGDTVSEHQVVVRVETDKALVEVPSPTAGRIGRIRHQPGDTVHVGDVLVSILAPGETDAAAGAAEAAGARTSTTVVGSLDETTHDLPPETSAPVKARAGQVLATPAVRRLARQLGVSIDDVDGSGSDGRVTEADVREHAASQSLGAVELPAEDGYGAVERLALRGVRRTIARRLKTAVTQAALATHMDDVDVTELLTHIGGAGGSFAWIVRATALALRQHERFHATLDDAHEEVLLKRYVHIGVAVDTPDGLMVPVIRDADQKAVAEIAAEIERLAAACRQRTIAIESLRGGTFSISNIGSLGGTYATPIPNYPEVAILATGRISERLARASDASIVSRFILPASLSFDHRVVDGADAARFVNTIKELVAQPSGLE